MLDYELSPLVFKEMDDSPELDEEVDSLRLSIVELQYEAPVVRFQFRAAFALPMQVSERYERVENALVLVVNDVDAKDCFAVPMVDPHKNFQRPRQSPNQVRPPELPLAPRGALPTGAFEGGWVNGEIEYRTTLPISAPGVFVHMVIENYVSNSVGLDLTTGAIVEL